MKTLQQIRHEYANEKGYNYFELLLTNSGSADTTNHCDLIAKRYAEEVLKEAASTPEHVAPFSKKSQLMKNKILSLINELK